MIPVLCPARHTQLAMLQCGNLWYRMQRQPVLARCRPGTRRATMSHLVDKKTIGKAGTFMTEGVILGGFAICALAAVVFDIVALVR